MYLVCFQNKSMGQKSPIRWGFHRLKRCPATADCRFAEIRGYGVILPTETHCQGSESFILKDTLLDHFLLVWLLQLLLLLHHWTPTERKTLRSLRPGTGELGWLLQLPAASPRLCLPPRFALLCSCRTSEAGSEHEGGSRANRKQRKENNEPVDVETSVVQALRVFLSLLLLLFSVWAQLNVSFWQWFSATRRFRYVRGGVAVVQDVVTC